VPNATVCAVIAAKGSRGRMAWCATNERKSAGHKNDWAPFGQNADHPIDLEARCADRRSCSQTGPLPCSLKNVRAVLWRKPQELIQGGSGNLVVPACWTAHHDPVIGGRS